MAKTKIIHSHGRAANRQAALDSVTVTISTGKVFDAIEAGLIKTKEEYPLQWVLAGSETGVGTPIAYAELVEASALANQNRAKIWLKS